MAAAAPSDRLFEVLRDVGIDFCVSVPCKKLDRIITLVSNDPGILHTPVTREEEGIGLMAGAFLAGRHPAMLLQNSGFGNCINVFCSLVRYYEMPMLFVCSHRGTAGEPIAAQKPMGEVTQSLLDTVGVTSVVVESPDQLAGIREAISEARKQSRPFALLLPIAFWEGDV